MSHVLIYGDIRHTSLPEYLMKRTLSGADFSMLDLSNNYSVITVSSVKDSTGHVVDILTAAMPYWLTDNNDVEIQYERVYTEFSVPRGEKVLNWHKSDRHEMSRSEIEDSLWAYWYVCLYGVILWNEVDEWATF